MNIDSNLLLLWGIGVGSVIGGDFFGWSYMLIGGIGAGLISLISNLLMYFCLAKTVAALVQRVKKPGGAAKLVGEGLGSKFGLMTAAIETAKILWSACALANGTIAYIRSLFGVQSSELVPMIAYVILFGTFTTLQLLGTRISGSFQVMVTLFSLVVLAFYWISVATNLSPHYALSSDVDDPNSNSKSILFVDGLQGFILSQPFGAWLFGGFEELPLIACTLSVPLAGNEREEKEGENNDINNDNKYNDSDRKDVSCVPCPERAEVVVNVLYREVPFQQLVEEEDEYVDISTHIQRTNQSHTKDCLTDNDHALSNFVHNSLAGSPRCADSTKERPAEVYNDHSMIYSYATVAISAILTVLLGSFSAPGAIALSNDSSPLVSGAKGVFGTKSWVVDLLSVLVVIALVTPFNAFLLFAAHHVQHLACDGVLPSWLSASDLRVCWNSVYYRSLRDSNNREDGYGGSVSHDSSDLLRRQQTPSIALLVVSIVGLVVLLGMTWRCGTDDTGNILVTASCLPAFCSYVLQFEALISLQRQTLSPSGTTCIGSRQLFVNEGFIRLGQLCAIVNILCLVYGSTFSITRMSGVMFAVGFTTGLYILMLVRENRQQ